jgi:CheY-like chemotaxis protein
MAVARILVAEDDVGVRALIGSVLRRSGHQIEFAADGREAIDRLSEKDYDAVFLDLMMPQASGFEVLAWLHRAKPGAGKRSVIVVTAMAERDLIHLSEDRVFAVLRKPFDIDQLVQTLNKCLAAAPQTATGSG